MIHKSPHMSDINLYHKYLYAIRYKRVKLGMNVIYEDKLLDNFLQMYAETCAHPADDSDKEKKKAIRLSEKNLEEKWAEGRDIVIEYCVRMQGEIMNGVTPEQIYKHLSRVLDGFDELWCIL